MRAVGERNFQSEGDRYKENITLSLHYMVSMCKGCRESLVDNHIMGNIQKMDKRRVITDRDTRLIKRVWPTPRERKEFGPKRSVTGALLWWFPVGTLRGWSF